MRYLRTAIIAVASALMLALIIFPDRYISSVAVGLRLFAACVLPALFPFFFLSHLLTSLGVAQALEKPLKKPASLLFNSPAVGGYIMVISLLSGYPVGAKLVADCYKNGTITAQQAKNISAFTSASGPLFIVGSVATHMLGNKNIGFVILLSHYLATLITGILLVERKKQQYEGAPLTTGLVGFDSLLGDSITSGIMAAAVVGGYIAVFGMLADVLRDFGILGVISGALQLVRLPAPLADGVAVALVEMTRGCSALSASGFPTRAIAPIIAALVSFGGLSVCLQSMTFLAQCKIKPLFYLKVKLSQSIIAFFLATVFCLIF